MDIDELLAQAIFESHKLDLQTIRKYVAWVKFRRVMNNQFYFNAHWLTRSSRKQHWIGMQHE